MYYKVRPIISSTNLSTLGNRMKHCGKAFSKRESKSYVSSKEIKKKKFPIEIDFVDIILKILARAFWLANQNIYVVYTL